MAACDASASTISCSSAPKVVTSPVTRSRALISCSTPITSSPLFSIGSVRNERERYLLRTSKALVPEKSKFATA